MLEMNPLIAEVAADFTAKERLWLTAEGDRLVRDGDPAAASLFVAAGHRIARADAERYGLLGGAADPEEAPESETANEAPGTSSEPPEDEEAPESEAPVQAPQAPARRRGRPPRAQG